MLARQVITEAADGTEGLTISGGEPMEQAGELVSFIEIVHHYRPEWSIGIFSGYSHYELTLGSYRLTQFGGQEVSDEWKRIYWSALRSRLDFAVLGRYDRTRPCSDGLISSHNQTLELFTDHYRREDFQRLMEVSVSDNGLTTITGFSS
jgi:anaerobic ribonucleoside-triphosphate reductase activating protein